MLPSWISKYIGLPFEDKGRGPSGFDCWGIVTWIYMQELGLILPEHLTYESVTDEKDDME